MATEDEILKSLHRIEQVLKGAATTTAGLGRAPRVAGAARREDDRADGARTFKATVAGFSSLNDASTKLTKTFSGLSKTVLITRDNFVQMNRSMRAYARGLPTANLTGGATKLTTTGGGGKPPPNPITVGLGGGGAAGSPLSGVLAPLQGGVKQALGAFTLFRVGVTSILASLSTALDPIIEDFFKLHARGIDASQSLGQLYFDAARAGMGLQEYTELLEQAGPAVVRAGSFKEFGDRLAVTREQLAGLGVFGDEATRLSAELANTTTVLGIPQAQLSDATSRQVAIFEQLRRTTMMTADTFKELTADLQNNEQVQGELLGLARNERAARFASIAQTNAIGYAMGLSAKASRELGAALLEQRKLTVEQRFKAAGGIRQTAGLAGLDPGEVETLARLVNRKIRTPEENRIFVDLAGKFTAGMETLANSGDVNNERLAEHMGDTTEAIRGQIDAVRQAELTRGSREVTPVSANAEFGKGANDLVKGAGMLLSYAEGLSKNPIARAMAGAVGSAAFTLAVGTAIGAALRRLPLFGGPGATPAGQAAKGPGLLARGVDFAKTGIGKLLTFLSTPFKIGPGTTLLADLKGVWGAMQAGWSFFVDSIKNIGGTAAKAGGWLKEAGNVIGTAFKTFSGWVKVAVDAAPGVLKGFGSIAGKLLKGIPVLGNIISFFVDAVGEAFTGNVAAAFNEDGGGWLERIGNVVFAAINGLFGGIFGLVDKAVQFFGFEGLHLENAWDKFAAVMRGGFFSALASIAEAVTLGDDNKLSRYFREAADNSFKVLDQLAEDQTATISSLGEKNNKKLDEQKVAAKKSTEAVAEVTKNVATAAGVITSTKNLAEIAIGTANSASTIAVPGQLVRPGVILPEVNKPTEPAAGGPGPTGTEAGVAAATAAPDLVTQLTAMVSLLQQSLEVEKTHAGFTEAIARATSRVPFADADRLVDRVIKPSGLAS